MYGGENILIWEFMNQQSSAQGTNLSTVIPKSLLRASCKWTMPPGYIRECYHCIVYKFPGLKFKSISLFVHRIILLTALYLKCDWRIYWDDIYVSVKINITEDHFKHTRSVSLIESCLVAWEYILRRVDYALLS